MRCRRAIRALALCCGLVGAGAGAQEPVRGVPTVGLESELSVTIPGTAVEVIAIADELPVRLAIAEQEVAGDGVHCRLRYRGLAAGTHDLARYLRRVDGSTAVPIPPILVDVVPVLRPGELIDVPMAPQSVAVPAARSAWWLAPALTWLVVLPTAWLWRRRRVQAAPIVDVDAVAAAIRPLAAMAVENRLSVEGWARLERLLLLHWQQRLGWGDRGAVDLVRELHEHADAGPVLRAVRAWVHDGDRAAHGEAAALLRSYADEGAA